MSAHAELKECIADLEGADNIYLTYKALKLSDPATSILLPEIAHSLFGGQSLPESENQNGYEFQNGSQEFLSL